MPLAVYWWALPSALLKLNWTAHYKKPQTTAAHQLPLDERTNTLGFRALQYGFEIQTAQVLLDMFEILFISFLLYNIGLIWVIVSRHNTSGASGQWMEFDHIILS